LEKTLDGWGCDKAGTAGSRDKLKMLVGANSIKINATYSDRDGTALATLLGW